MTTWYGIETNGLLTVRVGSGGAIETNEDPTAPANVWLARTSGVSDTLHDVVWNGLAFAAVGDNGTIILSADGVDWVSVTSGVSVQLDAIAAAGFVLIAVGDLGTIIQSDNGSSWEAIASGTTAHLRDVTTGNGQYIIVGDGETVLYGSITTTILEVHLVEGVICDDGLSSIGTFNAAATDGMLASSGEARQVNFVGFDTALEYDAVGLGDTLVHEVAGDVQSGVDNTTTDLDVVVSEAVGYVEGLTGSQTDSGSGEPLFQSVDENAQLFQPGAFVDAIYNTGVTDDMTASSRLFDSSEIVRELLTVADTNLMAYLKEVAEDMGIASTLSSYATLLKTVAETVAVSSATSPNGIFVLTADDSFAAGEVISTTQLYDILVSESLAAIAGFTFQDLGAYFGVSMNVKNQAVTEYDGFDFNSLARIAGNYYAARGDGVHLLSGDKDGTLRIDAVIRTGLLGSEKAYRRVERAFLALRNSGKLVLKTIVRDLDGNMRERWYETENTSDTIRGIRMKLAKGVKSHFWQFELVNKAGADFEIESLELVEIPLTRRV